jgi:hypothetical protein
MASNSIKKYIKFVGSKKPIYFHFNKQLVIGELAGFGAGIGVAEAAAALTQDELAISISSGFADYAGSILGFLAIFYHDSKSRFPELTTKDRFIRVMREAFQLWPSIVAADIAYIFIRPYMHFVLLLSGFEAGVAATIAHFAAFGVFNGVAILSRSIIDFTKRSKVDEL